MNRNGKKISRREIKLILTQIYAILDGSECDFKIRYSRKYSGFYHLSGKKETIYLNPWNELVGIIIHECVHARNFGIDSDSEVDVLEFEEKVFKSLTNEDIKNMAKKIMLGRTIISDDFKNIPANVIGKIQEGG